MIESSSYGNLKKAANATAFPDILCPIGCYAHVEMLSDGYLELLPMHHFINRYCDVKSFGMNKGKCCGFKPEWPRYFIELNVFTVCPSVYVDSKKGLCIIMCSKKIHADGSKEYLHPPRNPILKNNASLHEDYIAPVTVCPKIVRRGVSNSKTTSFNTCKLTGAQGGCSSFTLRTNRDVNLVESFKHGTAMGLSLKYRPDIYASIVDRSFLPPNFARNMLSRMDPDTNSDLTPELMSDIQDARKSGTYVSLHDSLLLMKSS